MKTQAQVVVIGGGLVGCSILYHLTKLGWNDVMLVERDELTAGSTWHAAGGIHGLHDNNNISQLQYYTMQIYKDLEGETGQGCGVFQPGSLYLAQTEAREHQLRLQVAKAKYFDVEFYEVSLDEAAEMHPLINFDGVRCAMYEAAAGNVDPSGVTHAFALGARNAGAEVHRHTEVLATEPRPDGTWTVVTNKGDIHAEIVVNAAGLWGRELAKMAGIYLPLMTMEHQYLVTDVMPEVADLGRRLPSVADRDGEYYCRHEGEGLLVGAYERDGRIWAEQGMPLNFGMELLDPDLDRMTPNILQAMDRIPALQEAGIKTVINGPMIWSPDAGALFGPVPELNNYYCCNGIVPGFSQSGGLGLMLAQWIVEGESELDMFGWDLARYGTWADKEFAKARAFDCYSHRFSIHFPYEEREAGRPMRQRPVFELQRQMGAVFGLNYGWEHPLWFAPEGTEPVDSYGFVRQPWHEHVGQECKALRAGVGLIDVSNFAKYEVRGAQAREWLDRVVANKVPTEVGRMCLAPLLGVRGGIAGDFTITCLADDHYMIFGSGMAERYHKRFFDSVAKPEGVTMRSLTDDWAGFMVAGPASRELLQGLTETDMSNDAFKFLRSRPITVAGIDALALRVSFTGDLGWEIYVPEQHQLALYQALLQAGEPLGIRPAGGRALLSLRVEKGYGSWGREYSPEYWPQEVGMDRLVKLDKPEFLGRDAYLAIKDETPRWKLVSFSVETTVADASGGEPIFALDGTPVGQVTSGSYGHTVDKSLALGAIRADYDVAGTEFDIAILGQPHRATLLAEPLYDPEGARLRS